MSMIGIAEPRPPYVTFESRAMEDREASIEAGKMVYKDVDYALITPQGSKDRIERIAQEWLAHIRKEAAQGRFDERWVEHFSRAYQAFRDNKEPEVDGTALRDWPGLSPAQLKNFQAINLRTVEDIAQANEETLQRMGMGARDLQKRARNWLEAASGQGKLAENLSALQSKNEALESRNKVLEERLAEVSQRLAFLEKNGGLQVQDMQQVIDEPGDITFN